MRPFLRIAVLAVGSLAFAAVARADTAAVIVAEDGGYSPATVRTVRSLLAGELRLRGVSLIEDPRLQDAPASEAIKIAAELGAKRVFVLRLGRLEEKVVMSLEESAPESSTPSFAATLTAGSIDEADKVLARLVRSVLGREPVEKGARITSVTQKESEPFLKKPGEGLWILGLSLVPLGGSFGWSHEAQRWRLGVLLQAAENDPTYFGVDGAWLPLDGSISPYLGAGLGVVGAADEGNETALGTKLEAGVEFFRLHKVRLIAGVNVVIPFKSLRDTDSASVALHLRLGL